MDGALVRRLRCTSMMRHLAGACFASARGVARPEPARRSNASDRHSDPAVADVDHVEALLLLAHAGRGRGAGLDDQRPAGTGDEVARVMDRRMMGVAGEQQVDPGLLDRVERQLLPADRALDRPRRPGSRTADDG